MLRREAAETSAATSLSIAGTMRRTPTSGTITDWRKNGASTTRTMATMSTVTNVVRAACPRTSAPLAFGQSRVSRYRALSSSPSRRTPSIGVADCGRRHDAEIVPRQRLALEVIARAQPVRGPAARSRQFSAIDPRPECSHLADILEPVDMAGIAGLVGTCVARTRHQPNLRPGGDLAAPRRWARNSVGSMFRALAEARIPAASRSSQVSPSIARTRSTSFDNAAPNNAWTAPCRTTGNYSIQFDSNT